MPLFVYHALCFFLKIMVHVCYLLPGIQPLYNYVLINFYAAPESEMNFDRAQQYPDWENVPVTSQSKQRAPTPQTLIQTNPKSPLVEGVPEMPGIVCSSDTRGKEMTQVCYPAAEPKELDLNTLFSESSEIEAIYGRLMMIGHAGAGKTSLQLALMNKKIPPNLSSTPLATAKSVKCNWTCAGEEAGCYWKEMCEDDEVMELAGFILKSVSLDTLPQLIAQLQDYAKDAASTSQVSSVHNGPPRINHTMVQQVLKKLMKDVLLKLMCESSAQSANTKTRKSDVLLYLWDSGGQRVFLDILPAFLTSRTIFMLVFDASRDLNAKLQLPCQKEGNIIHTEHYHLSSVQLLLQWMASIHTQLHLRKSDGTPVYLPYPRMLLVGTHRDKLELSPSGSEGVHRYLHSQYKGKAYAEMLMPQNPFYLVDNTLAGQGEFEDTSVKEIREHVHTFSSEHFVVKNVPSSWAFFRKVLQKVTKEARKPVITYEEVMVIARACSIKSEDVPHVLSFYHELGVLLYYVQVAGHKKKWVIADPQWLIKELAKVLSPTAIAQQDHCVEHQWELLRTHGILVEELYRHVWGESGEEFINLLQHFYLAAEVSNVPHRFTRYKGKKYFVPCMLSISSATDSREETVQRETTTLLEAPPESTSTEEPMASETRATAELPNQISNPDPIHLVFDTEYVPPGYYIRLLASIAKLSGCKILFQYKKLNRYQVTFAYKVNNEVTVTENLHSIVIEVVTVGPKAERMSTPQSICNEVFQSLSTSISEVVEWFPSVEVLFAFNCKNLSCASMQAEPHFVTIDEAPIKQGSLFRCQNERVCTLTPEQLHWFEPVQSVEMNASQAAGPAATNQDLTLSSPIANADTNQDLTLSSLIASLSSDVQRKWYSFGVALGVDTHILDIIKADSSNDTRYAFKRMLSSWMRAHENPTWEDVNQALKRIDESPLFLGLREALRIISHECSHGELYFLSCHISRECGDEKRDLFHYFLVCHDCHFCDCYHRHRHHRCHHHNMACCCYDAFERLGVSVYNLVDALKCIGREDVAEQLHP